MLKTTYPAYIRLVEEKANLEKKVEKIEEFVRSIRRGENTDANISHSELQLLEEQLHYMRGYLRVLNTRIANVSS